MTSGMETRAPWTAPQDQTRGSRSSREPGIGGDAARVLELGADFAIVGRSAILHHDFPKRVAADPHFKPVALPVTREYLQSGACRRDSWSTCKTGKASSPKNPPRRETKCPELILMHCAASPLPCGRGV